MTILLTAQVSEALEEVYGFVRTAAPSERIVLHAPKEILAQAGEAIMDDPQVSFVPARNVQRSRVIPKSLDLAQFLRVVARERPRIIASGSPFIKHRLASKMFRVPHVAYVRGLLFNPNQRVGLSDMLRFKIFRGRNLDVLNACAATKLLTVAELNKDFMVKRGVSADRITLVGPVWLEEIPRASSDRGTGRVYFVSQPWAVHGDDRSHGIHVEVIARLHAKLTARGKRLTIRAHPRDYYPYETDPKFAGAAVQREPSKQFLAQLRSSDVLISNLSTMAFEAMHLGVQVVFYEAQGLTELSMEMYPRLGITPHTLDEISSATSIEALAAKSTNGVFAPVDLDAAVHPFRPASDRESVPDHERDR